MGVIFRVKVPNGGWRAPAVAKGKGGRREAGSEGSREANARAKVHELGSRQPVDSQKAAYVSVETVETGMNPNPNVRWCERTGVSRPLLLDCGTRMWTRRRAVC
ncbi:hypothetical protein GCM10027018_17980 [Paenibacillus thermoaerophilus]